MSTEPYITRDKCIAMRIQALCWKDGKSIGEALNIALGAHGFDRLCEVAVEEATRATKADLEIIREVATRNIDTVEKLRAEVAALTLQCDAVNAVNAAMQSENISLRGDLTTEKERAVKHEQEIASLKAGLDLAATDIMDSARERATLTAQRDALLEMVWIDGPGEPTESIEEWKAQFAKEWVRRDSDPGPHSCGDHCQRPACVLRRERDELKASVQGYITAGQDYMKERDALKTGSDLIAAELADTKRHLKTLREKYDTLDAEWRVIDKPVGNAMWNLAMEYKAERNAARKELDGLREALK